MKKLFIAILFLLTTGAFAQVEIGIMFAPNLSINRVEDGAANFSVDNDGVGLRFTAGPTIDIFLKENIAFSTGAFLSIRRAGISFSADTGSVTFTPSFNLQYIQIPLGFKLFTNNIAERLRLYFELGATLDVRVSEQINDEADLAAIQDQISDNNFSKIVDSQFEIGIGGELGIGESNKVFGGIRYNRGLINVLTGDFFEEISKSNVRFNNDAFSLVVGFKF